MAAETRSSGPSPIFLRSGRYAAHQAVQLGLATLFAVAVVALEIDIRMKGGMGAFSAGGRYDGTVLLEATLYSHHAASTVNAALWLALPLLSLRRRRAGALPGAFSDTHRRVGWWALVSFALTAATGLALYIITQSIQASSSNS